MSKQLPPEIRVFVVNNAGHNYEAAKKWGKLISILEGNTNIFRPDRTLHTIANVLKENHFNNHDFILLSGSAYSNVLVSVCLCTQMKLHSFGVLVYNAKRQEYLPYTFDIDKYALRKYVKTVILFMILSIIFSGG